MRGLADLARRKDAEEDFAAKAILDQLQTKTVGAPPSSTGLTGDQLPDTIFSLSDFETVKNQVTLQLSNLELLNVLNTIGQITNKQSQSGPITNTGEIATATITTSSVDVDLKAPNPGEVWQVMGVSAESSGSLSTLSGVTLYLKIDTESGHPGSGNAAYILEWSGSGSIEPADTSYGSPIFVDENLVLKARIFVSGGLGAGEEVKIKVPLVRVR